MDRTRRVLMVGMVAMALAADRAHAAAPVLRPQVAGAARQFAGRLVVSLRRTVPAVRLHDFGRVEGRAIPVPRIALPQSPLAIHPVRFPPMDFRLPPPLA